jgi:mono/diheme cytochrome c family protein
MLEGMAQFDVRRRSAPPRHRRPGSLTGVAAVVVAVVAWSGLAPAAESAATPKEIRERIDAAAKLLDADKPDAAVTSLGEALGMLETLASAPRPTAAVKTLADRATVVRRRLEKAGADVTGLVVPGAAKPPAPSPPPAGQPVVGKTAAVSFSRQVAPILARSCGGCHIAGKKGGFQMASYEGLMRTGMVQRGQGQASRLVDVILTGDMPRGGGKVTSAEVATLVAWIDAGAPFDGPNPALGIDLVARGGAAPPTPSPAPAIRPVAVKPGEVSFATDVAPLLQEHCLKCHGGDETEANLSMASFEALLKGGRSTGAVVAGKGEDSLLVKKLRGAGIDGQRMPLGGPPLPDATIAMIAKWIDEGARLDMLTSRTPLDAVVAAGQAKKLTDAELAKKRFAAGEKLWRRVIPDEDPGVQTRAGVCVIGNLPADRLAEVADVAESVAEEIRSQFGVAGPLLKGGVVIYAVKQAVDYSAVWQVLSNAERPKGLAGHAGVSGDVVYGALLVPANQSPDDLRAGVADVIAAAAFAGRSTPGWFSQGAGRVAAGRVAAKADVVQQWRKDAAAAALKVGSAADFLTGHADPAATALAAGGLLGTLASGGRLGQMAAALDGGAPFDEAFAQIFRTTPAQAFEKWAARAAR